MNLEEAAIEYVVTGSLADELSYVALFCEKFQLDLTDIREDQKYPLGYTYCFNKSFGPYSIEGIKRSLE